MSARFRDDSYHETIEREPEMRPYQVKVSARFVLMGTLASCLLAFAVGRASRLILLEGPRQALQANYRQSTLRDHPIGGAPRNEPPLPLLVAKDGETIPHTKYTSKTFDTAKATLSSSWLVTSQNAHLVEGEDGFPASNGREIDSCEADMHGDECLAKKVKAIADIRDEEEILQPAGEHLMVDIKNVDGAFLNSQHRLASAMIDVANAANLILLSYHCHGMQPTGVSCAGILLHNFIAFHTWPDNGVITFDLVAGGGKSILSVLPVIEERFGVPQAAPYHGKVVAQPSVRWAHKLRGFRHHSTKLSNLFEITDLGKYLVSILGTEFKEEIASVETDFQRIDIYDVIFQKTGSIENYRKSLSNDGSYESRHKSLFRPDRVLFLDGWLQSTLKFEAAYHEALVHPALFAHSNPKRVAIIGGGEGATLREVLKHNTVEKVSMIEIDEQMVTVSKESIPEWSDCSELKGSAPWCVDDPRTSMYYEDAHEWFMSRYSDDGGKAGDLDVIILDALDPESEVPFAKALYGDDKFMRAFFNSLSDDGILVMQLGEAPSHGAPDETVSKFKNRVASTTLLGTLGFESIHAYEECHCGFYAPWTYVIGFKSYDSRQRWYANSAQIDLEVQMRGVRTKSGEIPFHYFDGPTMVSYQVPHRMVEAVFCKRQPTPEACLPGQYEFDPELPNVPSSSFEVKQSAVGDQAGRGLFTKVEIPEDAYLSAETNVQALKFMPTTVDLIQSLAEEDIGKSLDIFNWYMTGYGFYSRTYGEDPNVNVDSSIPTYVNHGCKGSYNMGTETPFDEFTASSDSMPDGLVDGKSHSRTTTFNPVVDRHLPYQGDQSIRFIKAGEEILDNYLAFTGNREDWANDVTNLREQCSGEGIGEVTSYETARSPSRNSS